MSYHVVAKAAARPNRSEPAAPGSAPLLFRMAAVSVADVLFLDPESAVAPGEKPQALRNLDAMAEAGVAGWGAMSPDWRLIDHASIEQAEPESQGHCR